MRLYRSIAVVCLALAPLSLWGRERLNFYCQQGGVRAYVSNVGAAELPPTARATYWVRSFPSALAIVYDAGTTTPATIYSDAGGTPKANPFAVDSVTAYGYFYADNGRYDVRCYDAPAYSPARFTAFTLSDYVFNDSTENLTTFLTQAHTWTALQTFSLGIDATSIKVNGTLLACANLSDCATLELVARKGAASGYAGLDGSSYLQAANFPAFTGDVTKPAGSLATTVVALRNKALPTLAAGYLYYDGAAFSFSSSGGMINPMNAVGDIIYGGAAGNPTRLGGNTTTTKMPLISQGTGAAAQAPTFGQLGYSDLSGTVPAVWHPIVWDGSANSTAFTSSQVVIRFKVLVAQTIPVNGTGTANGATCTSYLTLNVAATASTTFNIQKNGSTVGTVAFGVGGTTGTFSIASPVSLAVNDTLTIVGPGSADTTAAGMWGGICSSF